jgi:hypothetical protein
MASYQRTSVQGPYRKKKLSHSQFADTLYTEESVFFLNGPESRKQPTKGYGRPRSTKHFFCNGKTSRGTAGVLALPRSSQRLGSHGNRPRPCPRHSDPTAATAPLLRDTRRRDRGAHRRDLRRSPTISSPTPTPMAMTVDNCRKRGTDAFLNDLFAVPSDAAPLTKRGRCSPSVAAVADLGFPLECDPIETLRLIFPHADPQVRRPCALIDQSLLPSRSFFWSKSFLLVLFFLEEKLPSRSV